MQAVKQTQGIAPASGQFGSSVIPFGDIEIPEVFGDEQIEGLTKVLEIRKYLMDRQLEIRKLEGVAMRHRASILKLQDRLACEKLRPADALDIEGRLVEAQARLDGCRDKAQQYHFEMLVQSQRLKG